MRASSLTVPSLTRRYLLFDIIVHSDVNSYDGSSLLQ